MIFSEEPKWPLQLYMTVGLPRSGKTTWASSQGVPVVNPDSIRLALHGKRFIPRSEGMVWAIAKIMVRALFLAGHTIVILDSCATTKERRAEWDEFPNTRVWFQTSVSECLARARAEKDEEILPVIEKMANQFEPPLHYILPGN